MLSCAVTPEQQGKALRLKGRRAPGSRGGPERGGLPGRHAIGQDAGCNRPSAGGGRRAGARECAAAAYTTDILICPGVPPSEPRALTCLVPRDSDLDSLS